MVEVVAEGVLGRCVITQEPTPPELIPKVQDVQCGTLGEKVWAELPQNVINLDSNQEEYSKEEEILKTYIRTLNPEDRSKKVEKSGGKISGRDGFPS